jgi:hypothetical protein
MDKPAKRNLMSLVLSTKTTNVLRHLLVPQIDPHPTVFCTYDKTFHCELMLHAYQSLSSSYDH